MNTAQEVISKLEADLQIINAQLEMLDTEPPKWLKDAQALKVANSNAFPEWICAWPETLLSVDTNADCTEYIITTTIKPTRWSFDAAQFICMNVQNGRHERPVMMTERTFYQMAKEKWTKTLEDFKLLARL